MNPEHQEPHKPNKNNIWYSQNRIIISYSDLENSIRWKYQDLEEIHRILKQGKLLSTQGKLLFIFVVVIALFYG